jgi:hypothetical protein
MRVFGWIVDNLFSLPLLKNIVQPARSNSGMEDEINHIFDLNTPPHQVSSIQQGNIEIRNNI